MAEGVVAEGVPLQEQVLEEAEGQRVDPREGLVELSEWGLGFWSLAVGPEFEALILSLFLKPLTLLQKRQSLAEL